MGFYGALALRLEGFRRWVTPLAGAALAALIGLSRLYLGVHYPTDVIAGYLAAALWLVSVRAAWLLLKPPAWHDPPRAGP